MQYGGFLLSNHSNLEEKYDSGHAYTQFIGTCEGVKVDIPKGFEDASKYNGTLAHKTQHDFNPNGAMRRVIAKPSGKLRRLTPSFGCTLAVRLKKYFF